MTRSIARSRWLGMALLAAAFIVGGLTGAATDRVLSAGEPEPAAEADCEPRERRPGMDIFAQVGVDAAQRAEIDRILENRRQETAHFWEEAGPRLRAIVDSARAEIRNVLTPEQQATFDELRAKRRAMMRQHGQQGHDRKDR